MNMSDIDERIEAHFRAEAQAARDEYAATSHADKARYHAERWMHLDRAGELIEQQS